MLSGLRMTSFLIMPDVENRKTLSYTCEGKKSCKLLTCPDLPPVARRAGEGLAGIMLALSCSRQKM